ncbi:cation:proton antiporter [Rapidithrix thailandica]|uniref:Cation:proton antiporter n=1 Tax=Rapidithrix thailandica TaxID=413964 RepID=A0AAW9SDI9_9BACT
MEFHLLQDIVIILGLSVLIILVFQKLKIPAIMGFLLTGIIAGPHGLSLIKGVHEVELLSEIGVIFLLFVIGIEFSLKGLSSIKNTVFWGGLLQVGGTILTTAVCAKLMGLSLKEAIFMGFLLSLSSTAIVLKLLQERGEITSPHGRIAVAILIFQDLIVVPMMLFTPLLSGHTDNALETLLIMLAKVTAFIAVVILMARYFVPAILHLVVTSKSRELFIITVVGLCFATAWFTASVGLSLALGAFFAGLIISESDYSHQATANILPFREIFISFFFVSVGMLLDLKFFIQHIAVIHLLAFAAIFLKGSIAAIAVFILGYPPRTIFQTAFSVFQIGEFAFLLSATGMQYGLIPESTYQYFLAISIISMGATPFMMNYSSRIADFLIKAPLPKTVRERLSTYTKAKVEAAQAHADLHDHLVIVGYGINGENVAKAAKQAQIPYIIIELDPGKIRKAKLRDENVIFGDAADETILKHVFIHKARVVVIAISDSDTTQAIVNRIRQFTDTAYIIVRTRYLRDIEQYLRQGADEVIPEEFETSIEIFTRVLRQYLVPDNEIQGFINHIRSDNYDMLRNISGLSQNSSVFPLHIPDIEIATLPVQQGPNKIIGKSVYESGLRTHYGITVLAIKRGSKFITNIHPETQIKQDDLLYVFGSPDNIQKLNHFLKLTII